MADERRRTKSATPSIRRDVLRFPLRHERLIETHRSDAAMLPCGPRRRVLSQISSSKQRVALRNVRLIGKSTVFLLHRNWPELICARRNGW